MKKIIFLYLLILSGLSLNAQQEAPASDAKKVTPNSDGTWKKSDTSVPSPVPIAGLEIPKIRKGEQIIEHTGYTLSYDPKYKQARWVAYELTAAETLPEVERSNAFSPDPLVKSGSAENSDFEKSGYDKGHLAPAADMSYTEQTMEESFYLSNMSPQKPGFNRGIWKKLEGQVRLWAISDQEVYIVTGGVLKKGLTTIGKNKVAVPKYFYKVILDYSEPGIKGIGFILPNESSRDPLQHFAVTIDSVEKVTNIDFFDKLPDDVEKRIESQIKISDWFGN